MLAGETESHFRLKRALDVKVKLCLRQTPDKRRLRNHEAPSGFWLLGCSRPTSTLAPGDKQSCPAQAVCRTCLLAVGHPDIFDLAGVLEIPAAFTVSRVGKVDFPALVGPDLLQVPGRQRFGHGTPLHIPVAP